MSEDIRDRPFSLAPIAGLRLQSRWPFVSLAIGAAQRTIAYRGATLISLATGALIVLVQIVLWGTVFEHTKTVGAFSLSEIRTYVVLVYLINALLPSQFEAQMMDSIRTGSISIHLSRPLNYIGMQFSEALGIGAMTFLSQGIPVAVGAAIGFDIISFPAISAVLPFLISLLFGLVLKFLLCYSTSLLCFWTINGSGVQWTRIAVTNILSGTMVPIALLPGWLASTARGLPFGSMVYVPAMIFLGKIDGMAAWRAIALQAAWTCVLFLGTRLLWRVCTKRLVIQGG